MRERMSRAVCSTVRSAPSACRSSSPFAAGVSHRAEHPNGLIDLTELRETMNSVGANSTRHRQMAVDHRLAIAAEHPPGVFGEIVEGPGSRA